MGCRVCRARKVKCDGRPNGCRNCERLQLDCVGSAAGITADIAAASLRKIRTYRSCQSCRLSKTKCNGKRPLCARCAAKKLECVYDGDSAPRWAHNLCKGSAIASASPSEEDRDCGVASPGLDEAATVPPLDLMSQPPEPAVAGLVSASTAVLDAVLDPVESLPVDPLAAGSHSLAWLLSPDLPSGRNLRRVVEQYFANVHPLRCFAFVHKPSFMSQLDKGLTSDDESALLHVICAHGAKFLVLGSAQGDETPPPAALHAAGNQWAKRAEFLMLANFGRISVQRLMTAILLHDFHFRLGEYGQALMISGLAVRMAHALKINIEYNSDILCANEDGSAPSVASRESRRRLMWACYVLDAWAGSGIDQLTLLREGDIKIQLPCNERNFGLRIASVTETLGVGHVLQFLPPAIVPRRPAANMGIMAYYIRVVALWKRIVRYVNHLHASPPPWQPDSHFAALDADLHLWRRELPDFVEYSTETIYARLDSNQLGTLLLIHCTYHHNYLELYKITMPNLFKLAKPYEFPSEHYDFLKAAQANCYYHAHQIADILAEAVEYGPRLLSDSLLPFFVYDSSRVMLYYVARLLDPSRPDAQAKVHDAIKAVESNSRVLRLMTALFPVAQSLSTTIERWLSKIHHRFSRDDLVSSLQSQHRLEAHRSEILKNSSGGGGNEASVREAPDYMLPSITLHPMAGSEAGGKRTDDEAVVPNISGWSTVNPNAGNGGPASWDGTSMTAHQLVGLSQEVSTGPSLQHERPVGIEPPAPLCEALDLDDLQNFLSWDMYGIMEMGGGVSNEDMDDSVSQCLAGAI
ncbi:hypothetical protein CDD81_1403 [Ophiocordyceps australis]|uniref:Zn(2)-C6 fungal-type domain-containing protein n=1 Tax=Ophiocordyceps australis TaxID=1399860 RepID=A0A2C5XYZ6_9HYPO|nr:hypothetical protein CDD81_1403 [Ophiocordyceps australis]